MFHNRPPVFIFQNPVDRVPVRDRFKATELFTKYYGISLVSVDESLESVPAEELLLPPAELLSPLTNL